MALHLTIIKFPPGISQENDSKTFSGGGVIGRGASNDWVLMDPERFLSSKHCEIEHEAGGYYLIDLSTNGTFVNGAREPLGRGARIALCDGDSFDVGDYRFKAVVEAESNAFPDSPFGVSSGGASNPFDDVAPNQGFAHVPDATPESMHMSSEYGGIVADIVPDEMKVVDPLEALNIASSAGQDANFDRASNKSAGGDLVKDNLSGSQEDSANFLQAAADWPEAKAEESVIPEDWADDVGLGAQDSLSLGDGSLAQSYKLPDNDSLIVNKPEFKPAQAPPSPKPARPKPRSAPAPASKPSSVDRSLVDAIGFAHVNLTHEQIQDINGTVGVMMRETIEGLMQILRSRTSIKNEFRINITTIQPVENNPLKFSASVDEVLENMFLKDSRAYKKPVEAVQESLNTISDHQMAVIAGIRSAFKSVLRQFDPEALEESFKESGKSGVLGGVMKGRLWSAYQDHYQSMVNDMERSFQELFGDEFVQAYEDQLRKLSNARKRGR